jgi:hypothetical protein
VPVEALVLFNRTTTDANCGTPAARATPTNLGSTATTSNAIAEIITIFFGRFCIDVYFFIIAAFCADIYEVDVYIVNFLRLSLSITNLAVNIIYNSFFYNSLRAGLLLSPSSKLPHLIAHHGWHTVVFHRQHI